MKIYRLRLVNDESRFSRGIFAALRFYILISLFVIGAVAQSISIDYPTAVSSNEINGTIQARSLGDARLTSFYYTFNGAQGDIFINVSTVNFSGDIDVYAADGLRPLTKISFYADSSLTETGRVIYLRKPEKLILRVEGRSFDDNPATFKIKFAGSFVAVQDNGVTEEPKLPEVKAESAGGAVQVNSVGTIIKPKTQPTPEPKETIAVNKETLSKAASTENLESERTENPLKAPHTEIAAEAKPEVPSKSAPNKRAAAVRSNTLRTALPSRRKTAPKKITPPEPLQVPAPNPLENVRLLVVLKNGDKIEFPMSRIFRFTMNNGILIVITKDGKTYRRSILDVQKLTVE